MTMKKTQILMLTAAAGLLLGTAACRKDYYDDNAYQKEVHRLSPIDSVDPGHTWQLTTENTFRLTADAGQDVERVMLLTENPLESRTAEVVNQASLGDGQTVTLAASVPTRLSGLYAALVDKDGQYHVVPVGVNQYQVSFSGATQGTPLATPQMQTYTYLFEEDFPLPGDYDYNDVVLRIGVERTGELQLTLKVTVVAVGATKQIAAYVRLLGYKYQDIDSIRTASGKTFNDGLPQGSTFLVDNYDELLVEGRNGEAVVNLFADAHWAMNSNSNSASDYGILTRKKYNTGTGDYAQYENKVWQTQSYVITFKKGENLNRFTQEALDPFIVTNYNVGRYETHQEQMRAAQVLYQYSVSATLKDLPWALKIPTNSFRYPREGMEIGFRKRTETGVVAMFGAYVTRGHSFGEWAEDSSSSLDWYLYPDEESVW